MGLMANATATATASARERYPRFNGRRPTYAPSVEPLPFLTMNARAPYPIRVTPGEHITDQGGFLAGFAEIAYRRI
jgi:hypothetical protein